MTPTISDTSMHSSWIVYLCSPKLPLPPSQQSVHPLIFILSLIVSHPFASSNHQHFSDKDFFWTFNHYPPSPWELIIFISMFPWIFDYLVVLVLFLSFFSILALLVILHIAASIFSFIVLFFFRFLLAFSQASQFESWVFKFHYFLLDSIWKLAAYRVTISV